MIQLQHEIWVICEGSKMLQVPSFYEALIQESTSCEVGQSDSHTHTHIRLTALCPGLPG